MNVNIKFGRLIATAFTALLIMNTVHARDWLDAIGTPLYDPLLTQPPVLNKGKMLPGDEQVHPCDPHRDKHSDKQARVIRLTLGDAVDLALCHNSEVRSAWAAIKVQAAQLGEARAAYLPTLNVGVSRLNQHTTYNDSPFQIESNQSSVSKYASLTWRLLDFGGRNANHRFADVLLESALASHDAVLQSTLATVIGAYFDAQTASANRLAKEQGEKLAQQTLATAEKRQARGVSAQSDTLQAKTALAKAELENARAKGLYEKSLVALLVTIGLPSQTWQSTHLTLALDYQPEITTLEQDLASWISLALEQHPALVSAKAKLKSVQEKLTVVRSEGLPTLEFNQSQYINGRPNQDLPTTQTKESVTGFSVNFPLFDGFAHTYKVRGAQAQIEVSEAELQHTQNQLLGDVVKAHADAVAALRNLASSKRLMEAAQDAVDNTQRRYDKGIADISEMLNSQMALADAEQERVRSLAEWRSARLRLLANVGTIGLKDIRTDKFD